MKLEATNGPLKFHFSDGSEVQLTPGRPIELPPDRAERLLRKLPGRVRVLPSPDPAISECPAEPVLIEPADESVRARPVFWERDGQVFGPATVADFAKAGKDEYWLWIEYRGQGRWIRDTLLRSRAVVQEAIERDLRARRAVLQHDLARGPATSQGPRAGAEPWRANPVRERANE